MKLRFQAVLLAALAFGAVACDDDSGVTIPTPITITEPPFVGTLTVNGAVTQPFTATSFGTATITLNTLDPNPDSAVRVSMALGTWNGAACQVVIANDNAGAGTVLLGTISAAGNLCVRMSDAGRLTGPVTFDVTIAHP
jgi:hypothetical protein